MRIGIVYGHVASNLGDLSINQGVADMLRRIVPDAEVHVVLRDPDEAYLDVAEAAFKEIEHLTFGILRTSNILNAGALRDYARLERAAEYVSEPARFIADAGLTGCDVVLGNSGELLFAYENSDNHVELVWNMLPALAARAAGMRFITLPSTFGPFEAPALAPMVRAFFELNDAFAARESNSTTLLSEFLHEPSPPAWLDPAFFVSAPQPAACDGEPTLGLAMRLEDFGLRIGRKISASALASYRDRGFGDSRSFRFSLAAARFFLDRVGSKVHLLIASRRADHDLAHAITRALTEQGYGDRLRVVQPTSVSEYQEELAKVSFIVASRFHACVLGLLSGTPTLGVYFDEHGHKMPGLFDLLDIPGYCQNLSRTPPESLAESVVPLFLESERTFADMPERLHLMQEDTLKWLKQALTSKRVIEHEKIMAASKAYISSVEAIRTQTARNMLQEARHLEAESEALAVELDAVVQQLNAIEGSFSYQLGSMLVRAVRKPGRSTILLPYHVFRLMRTKTGRRRGRLDKHAYKPATAEREIAARIEPRAKKLLKDGKLGVWITLAEKHKEVPYFKQNSPAVYAKYRLLQHGFQLGPVNIPQSYQPRNDTVFYLLHNSLPYSTGGYAIRTHGLMQALVADGWHMYGITRLGFPFNVKAKRGLHVPQVSTGEAIPGIDVIDNVSYLRLLENEDQRSAAPPDTDLYMQVYIERLMDFCVKYNPSIIHAASFFWNGIAAVNVARILGLPSIYSARGLWYLTQASANPRWAHSDEYQMQARMDTDACLQATAVIAITTALKNVLMERGVPGDKILVVPNGVDTNRFVPVPRDRELEAQLGYAGKKVIGYIGAFAPYEGLEYLLQAASILRRRRRNDFRVLLIGDGTKYDELQSLCDELQLRDIVTLTGRVPHSEIERYYSLIDIVPLPRKGVPVCEIVSPLKPFEAMSMGKTVVASDVAALAEIVHDGSTGLLHRKDDGEHLAHALETLLDNPELTQSLGEAARKWVVANRDWRVLARDVGDLYRDLISRKRCL